MSLAPYPMSGILAVDRYLEDGYTSVVGMSSRLAAAITCGLLRIQTEFGIAGPVAEIGTFEGRFFIAMAHALAPGEKALGIDLFDWPNPQVLDRFHANCARHGVPEAKLITWKADSRSMKADTRSARMSHVKRCTSANAVSTSLSLRASSRITTSIASASAAG